LSLKKLKQKIRMEIGLSSLKERDHVENRLYQSLHVLRNIYNKDPYILNLEKSISKIEEIEQDYAKRKKTDWIMLGVLAFGCFLILLFSFSGWSESANGSEQGAIAFILAICYVAYHVYQWFYSTDVTADWFLKRLRVVLEELNLDKRRFSNVACSEEERIRSFEYFKSAERRMFFSYSMLTGEALAFQMKEPKEFFNIAEVLLLKNAVDCKEISRIEFENAYGQFSAKH